MALQHASNLRRCTASVARDLAGLAIRLIRSRAVGRQAGGDGVTALPLAILDRPSNVAYEVAAGVIH